MSRIGNKSIELKEGLTVNIDNNMVTVKGPKGELKEMFSSEIGVEVEENTIKVTRPSDSIKHKTLHGTTRAIINNMVEGVSEGYVKSLEIIGVGYKAKIQGNSLEVNAGYSHPVLLEIPTGITVDIPTQTEVIVKGIDKQKVGQFASEIRKVRPPEPYKGKGIRYKGEVVRRKEGKKEK